MTLRVCQVMLSKGFGGAERLFVDLVIALRGYDVEVLPICHPRGKAREILDAAGVAGVYVGNWGWWDPVAPRRIRALAKGFGVDVMHTHLARATYLTTRLRPNNEIPIVASLHNYGKRHYYHKADHHIAITEDGARHLREMGIRQDKITVLPNFSRVPAVEHERSEQHTPIRLLSFGRFVEKKGFSDLLVALAGVKERGIDFKLKLGGAGPLEKSLVEQVQRLGLSNKVVFTGWLENVVNELDQCDLFVLPSRSEPFGIVVLEAMARGIPIVTTRTEGPREFLSSDTAWFAPIGDAAALADVIVDAISDPQARIDKAASALSLFKSAYIAEQVVPSLLTLYQDVIRESRA